MFERLSSSEVGFGIHGAYVWKSVNCWTVFKMTPVTFLQQEKVIR